jgi:hypothetical protein
MHLIKSNCFTGLVMVFLISMCAHEQSIVSEKDLLQKKNPVGSYGYKINLTSPKTIHELLSSPVAYIDQEVLIEGQIIEVCPMRGCWVNVQDPETNADMRLKVKDGTIVFPFSAKGHRVKAQGIFQKLEFTEEDARRWKSHLAKEKGIILHPDSVRLKPQDLIEYRVFVNGAIIY